MDSLCHPWFTTTNLSYRFPILKLLPPPCAVLLVYKYYCIDKVAMYCSTELCLWRSCWEDSGLFRPPSSLGLGMVSVQHGSIVCSVCVQHVLWRDPCFHTPTTQPSSHIEPCQTITIGVLGALRPCGISHRLDLRHAPRCFPLGSNEGALFGTFRGEMRMNIRPRFHFCTFPIKPNTWHILA